MKIIVQKVKEASVTCGNQTNAIKEGLCVLLGIREDDFSLDSDYIIGKILNMRLWNDGDKTWAKSVLDIQGEILIISQFTLYGYMKGNKPDFHYSMNGEESLKLYEKFLSDMKKKYDKVKGGFFGEHMVVNIVNDGPCTIVLDSRDEQRMQGVEGLSKIGGPKAMKVMLKEKGQQVQNEEKADIQNNE